MKMDRNPPKKKPDTMLRRLRAFSLVDIYPVTCEELSRNRTDYQILEGIIDGGARIVQLRDKTSTKRKLYEKAVRFRETTTNAGLLLIINDHIDIALAVEADGVHLGQDDFPARIAKELFPGLIIGVSTHTLNEALTAEIDGADYINIGPIFPTRTKNNLKKFVGLELVKTVSKRISIPFTVMGGINSNNLDDVLAVGAKKVAMVTGITKADSIAATVRTLRKRIRAGNPP